MPAKQAKVVTLLMLRRMLRRAASSPFPARNRAMILLSVMAGLRACEIALLDWSMVLDARGKVAVKRPFAIGVAQGPQEASPRRLAHAWVFADWPWRAVREASRDRWCHCLAIGSV